MIHSSTNLAVALDEPSVFRRLLGALAPVKRDELATVAILTVNVFVLLTCYYLLKVLREPMILLGGGAELKAYASAGQTLLLLGVVPAFSWLSSRVDRVRLLTTMQLIFIGCLVAFYALAHVRAPIGLAFYLWLGIFNILVVANFWSFANDLYNEEQGKRLFAIIGVGASVGAIIGAFVPQLLHRVIGMYALMLVAAGGLAVSIALYRIADRRERMRGRRSHSVAGQPDEPAAAREPAMTRKGGFTLVIKDRYLRVLAAMLLIATVINTTGEYVIGKLATDRAKQVAAEVAPGPAAVPAGAGPAAAPARAGPAAAPAAARPAAPSGKPPAAVDSAQGRYLESFYSDYYALVNLLSFALQALVVTRLLVWLGIRRALFVMPLIVLGGWLAVGLFVSVTMVRAEKTAENSLDYSLHNTLRQALFLPTDRDRKYKAKAAIDTFFFRMGDVIAGLGIVFLFVEVLGLGVRAFAVLNVVLAVCWLALAAGAGRVYDRLAAASGGATVGDRSRAGRHGA
jgi:AAA family ATP:ADP antiporter